MATINEVRNLDIEEFKSKIDTLVTEKKLTKSEAYLRLAAYEQLVNMSIRLKLLSQESMEWED